jgi:hypothetical protein
MGTRRIRICSALRLLLVAGLLMAGCGRDPATTRKNGKAPGMAPESVVEAKLRAEYPLSLIPGGVTSDGDVEAARAKDPVLADHYAEVGFLRPAFLPRDQWLYASYRQGGSIVWTSSRVPVRAGELVLVDRSGNLVRGRCGNRLSDTPRAPVGSFAEPEVFSETPAFSFPEPVLRADSSPVDWSISALPDFEASDGPVLDTEILSVPTTVEVDEPGWPPEGSSDPSGSLAPSGGLNFQGGPSGVPLIPLFVPSGPTRSPIVFRPVVAPEPGTFWLLVAGAVLVAFGWRKART